ncbi:MAG: MFS transporter [Paracoccaceae bacterium]
MDSLRFIRENLRWLMAGLLLTFASSFGQTFFISIFAGEIRAEFGLSHGAWGAIYMIGTLASAIVMVWSGALTDRFRVRVIGGITLFLLAASCVAAALVSSLWLLPVVIFCLRLTGQGMSSHVATVAMARWFVAARGRALAVATLGFSIGEALLPLTFVALMGAIGWRASWVVCAAILLMIIPIIAVLLRQERTPQSNVTANQSFGMGDRHWSRKDVLGHRLFWMILPALLGPPAFGTAFFFHQVHLAEVKGWSHLDLVALFPVYTATAVISMGLSGLAIDRFGTSRLMPVYQIPLAAGFIAFSLSGTVASAGFAIMGFGITTGINATLSSAFWAEFYGTRHLGAIKAMAASVMVLGSAIGPGLTGLVIDLGTNFNQQMVWVAAYLILSAALTTLAIRQTRRASIASA